MKTMGAPGKSESFQILPQNISFQFLTKQVSVAAILIGGLVLLCWLFNISVFKDICSELSTIKVNTAICYLLTGASLWLSYRVIVLERSTLHEVLKQVDAEVEMRVQQRTALLHIANVRLQHLATVDYLTELANRRQFDRYLNQQWQQLRQQQKPLSLIMCDIDYFKLYNDHYGHQAGDKCLKQVSQAIRRVVRSSTALAARYGGEELAVILPNTNSSEATRVAKQIQIEIARASIAHSSSPISTYVTLSIGIATIIPNLKDLPENLVAIADKALYTAKAEGRNRYCIIRN